MQKNRKISWFLTLVFIFSIIFSVPAVPVVAGCQDISGHWAKPQIEYLVAQKIINGYPDNTFRPENPISRAEFIVMTNKAFDFTASTAINYSDVKTTDWFVADIARAKAAGYISGYEDGTMKPNRHISRQEVASIVARILSLQPADTAATLQRFSDNKTIASWSRDSIAAMVENGYLKGYPDNTFKAANSIKRAEAAVILTAVLSRQDGKAVEKPSVQSLFDKAGTYGPETGIQEIDDDVTISSNGVILNNTTITGNLTITEAVVNGDVEFNNVKVEGTAYINGGGENSITLNQCELNKVVVNKKDGKIRIVLSKDSSIKTLVADSGLKLVGSGKITDLTINSSGVEVEPKPINKPSIKSGITARVGGEKISGTTSGGGGGGSGGSPAVVTTANVSSAAELNTALGNSNITTITLTANITASPTVTRSLTMNFGAYTLTGNVNFSHNGTGTSVLTGSAGTRITGDLTVNTPNASFNNGVTVGGTVTVANVASSSWTESADGNTITITDPNGATITITGTPGSVTVTQDAGGNLTITVNPGASVTNITTNAPVNIVVETGATVTGITANAGAAGTTLSVNAPINLEANTAGISLTVGASGSANITGTQAGSVAKVNVTAITVTAAGNATTVTNGGTLQMSAAITPTNATNKAVTWSGTNGTGSATISSTGLLTATGVGTVTVKATAQDGSGIFGEATITIQASQAGQAVILSKVSGAGMPTSQIKVQINGSYINTYTLYFDGAPLATTTNDIVTIATAVLNNLSRVQILYNNSSYTTVDGGTWQ